MPSSGSRAPQLSGDEIGRIAFDWLRTVDPDREGQHYYDIAWAAMQQGTVAGKDQMKTVLGVIGKRGDLFEHVGPGTYTWVASDARAIGSGERGTRSWAMRTDRNRRDDLWSEIRAGRLRQGWGWDAEQDLQLVAEVARGDGTLSEAQRAAWGNRRMLTSEPDGIHVGDIILVMHMPAERRFSVVRVTGPYQYDGGQVFGDYGHILPVELLTGDEGIGYTDERLPLRLQTSLGNRTRLWNLDGFGQDIEELTRR